LLKFKTNQIRSKKKTKKKKTTTTTNKQTKKQQQTNKQTKKKKTVQSQYSIILCTHNIQELEKFTCLISRKIVVVICPAETGPQFMCGNISSG